MQKQPNLSFQILMINFLLVLIFSGCRKEFETSKSNTAFVSASLVASKPNILFIIGDDVGYEIPTCDGGQSYSTPNIDKIAQNGMLFTQCHSSPMCAPSRVSLLTGKYNFRNYTGWGYLSTDQKTIANMLSDAGYATCYAGKWQLDGGYNSIVTFGWQKSCVWLPFLHADERMEGSRYKSPKIYQDGKYLPDSSTLNKFADDIFTSYLLKFMDSANNLKKPFFAYYSMNLCHKPFSPTPDDPEYANWDFANFKSNKKFFPSMVKYMDKKVGQIINHLRLNNILPNTVVIYVADNGTANDITSLFNGAYVTGGKGETNELGTNVPLLIRWNNKVPAGVINNSLISFTDFLPTLADIAGTSRPSNYGALDGTSFYSTLTSGDTSASRKSIYNSYVISPSVNPWVRWVQNDSYKLYDTNSSTKTFKFVKISKGEPDSPPLKNADLTPEEKAIKTNFKSVLQSYHE